MYTLKNKQAAFTLIEAMIAIAIGGILVAVALPSYQTMVKNNCLTTNTNTLVSSLQLARSEAVKRRESISVKANASGWNIGWTIEDSTSNVLRDITLSCSQTTVTEASSDTILIYKSTGFIDNTATFNVCDDRTGETGRQITINAVGRPNTNSRFTCS